MKNRRVGAAKAGARKKVASKPDARHKAPQDASPVAKSDPLYNQSVEKALAILEAFGAKGRALNLGEIAVATAMNKSSAQRCTHTLQRLGYLHRDLQLKRWVLSPRSLSLANAYLMGHPLIEQATTHLVDLNQLSGESVSLSEPDGTDMVYIARFPGRKRFFIHMPVGHRLPMYCTAAGRAYLSALPRPEASAILRRSAIRQFTPHTTTDPERLQALVDAARKAGYAWADQESYRGDLTIAAAILGDDGRPIAAVNVSGPTSRWTMGELRAKLSSVLLETARAASSGIASRLSDQ